MKAAVLGTLVADAAGLGLHWIYSQGKIARIVKEKGGESEFLQPEEINYEGVPSFFAHPIKTSGDSSNYGEYLYVLLRAVGDDGFDAGTFVREFLEYFGVGGAYVGYADTPMRETIYSIASRAKEVHRTVLNAESTLPEEKLGFAAHYISHYYFESDTEGLRRRVRTPLKLKEWKKEELAEADRLVDLVRAETGALGPDDDQMPALTRSAVLAWFYAGEELDSMLDTAVRITNDNDDAVAYARFMAHIMRDLYGERRQNGESPRQVLRRLVEAHRDKAGEKGSTLIGEALAYQSLDYRRATKTFGAACSTHMAVPLVLHILLNTESFTEAVRVNNLASGDNCGRAIMLGALAGALYGIGGVQGIPQLWMDRTRIIRRIRATPGGAFLLG